MGDIFMIYLILIIIIIILLYLNIKKFQIDKNELQEYQKNLAQAKTEYALIEQQYDKKYSELQEAETKFRTVIEEYKRATSQNQQDLEKFFAQQKTFRQSELDTEFELKAKEKEDNLQLNYLITKQRLDSELEEAREQYEKNVTILKKNEADILADTQLQQQRYESLLAPLKLYEKERQERLFYTIQVPDEYKQDIDFLLTTVAQKVQHPDVINKLVWAEYVKPYIEDTFKRVGIENKPGIYKLTNLDNCKSYIGKSTDIKKRIADHFKSAIGIRTIANQAVHQAILETGFWNWAIEYVIYCDKDSLNDLEKYYINFFETQTFGYNKNQGGGG